MAIGHQSDMMTQRRMPGKIFSLHHCRIFNIPTPAFNMNWETFASYKFHFQSFHFIFCAGFTFYLAKGVPTWQKNNNFYEKYLFLSVKKITG
jgi:hypothetical protein